MSARVGLRFFQASRTLRTSLRQPLQRRRITTEANAGPADTRSGFARIWNSPVGPKTVHFWAPIMKWGLVLAGVSDFARPAESLSLSQNAALMGTGAIWTRWCFVIKPRNLFLAAVNFFLFCVGATQVTRIFRYQQSLKDSSLTDEMKKAAKHEEGSLEKIVKDPKGAMKSVVEAK